VTVDALSLQVFANLFASVAESMGVTLRRASFSPNIKMRRDYSCAVFDSEGRLLAQAAHIPVHLGAMPLAMDEVRRRYDLDPGDVVIMNDPYAGGTHLPDISLVSAAFDSSGRRIGYVMSRAHHADIGGAAPGSMTPTTSLYAEGIVIPPVRLYRGGSLNVEVMDLLLRNVRTPTERQGDFAAQAAAQRAGESALADLAARYGAATLAEHGHALQEYAARHMRGLIGQIPPGEYRAEDVLDGDGITPGPVPIRVTIRRRPDASALEIDFSGSSRHCAGPVNASRAVTYAATLYVLRALQQDDVPVNAGTLGPLCITLPPDSVINAGPPAAVAAGNVETSQRIVDVVFAALAAALPDRIPAASQGTMNNLSFGGLDRAGRPYAYYETSGGGQGARPGADGMSAVHDHMSNTLNTPVEALESSYPLRVARYEIRRRTGGSGASRGGDGLRRDIMFLGPADVSLLTERRDFPPPGLAGGSPGARGENVLIRDGVETILPGKTRLDVISGDIVSVRTPGGGGHGSLPGGSGGC